MANQDSTTKLYSGLHTAEFRNSTHRYYIDGKLKPGVTTIMGKVLSKEGLMLWPLNMAMKYIRENCTFEGYYNAYQVTADELEAAAKAYIKRRDAGASTGTTVHDIVERILLGTPPTYQEITNFNTEVALAYRGFEEWRKKIKPEVVAVEQVVYSHLHQFAGTFDSILKIDGKTYLVDLKTTNASKDAPYGIYAEYFIQLGAYYYAYEEQRQYELAHGGTNLVEIDDLLILSCKKNGQVHTLAASELGLTPEKCMKLWEFTLLLHNDLAYMKKKIGGK